MRCDGTLSAEVREATPTPDGWANFEHTGHITFACSHGLVITGPRDHVIPLAEAHRGLPSQGQVQTVLGRA